jgi:hypothetical protein
MNSGIDRAGGGRFAARLRMLSSGHQRRNASSGRTGRSSRRVKSMNAVAAIAPKAALLRAHDAQRRTAAATTISTTKDLSVDSGVVGTVVYRERRTAADTTNGDASATLAVCTGERAGRSVTWLP